MCFSPRRAGRPTEIAVQFRLRSIINVGEEVGLELPGFFSTQEASSDAPTQVVAFNTSGADALFFSSGQW